MTAFSDSNRVAVGQVGGPTAVINASLFGFLEEVLPRYEVYGLLDGLQGLAEGRLAPLSASTVERYRKASETPGAWLGAGRWKARTEEYVITLKERDIHRLVLIGGNGTMWSCLEIERLAEEMGYELAVLGIPKTVDNDLAETDHAPGFGSAARYVATIVRDISRDLESVRNFEAVRVLETMGRNVGWLAASSGYLKRRADDPPHLIYVPEQGLRQEEFLEAVKEVHRERGYAAVVVSEGLMPHENPLSQPLLGGVSRELAALVREELGLAARGELLGMGQRSHSLSVSLQDRREARELGREAARLMRSGTGGCMVALARISSEPYEYEIYPVPFERVAGKERTLPGEWVHSDHSIGEGFRKWLKPLVGEDLEAYPANLSEEIRR